MYFILPLLFSFSLFAAPNAKELSQTKKWHRLLHYKKTWTGSYESEADGAKFFLHKDGKSNPQKELETTIALFSAPGALNDEHPICRFPLRYKWLNQQLGMPWKADIMQCKKYVDFFSKLAAKRASVVFSSYYLGSPNSAFGHTLLRLSRYDNPRETEMLDYGINYSAVANEKNPFLYAVKGLFGGFEGKFAAIPYYYKIREYTNVEFRDLWAYDLKLTMPEVLEMVDHVWELGDTYFDYFYFHENCSYHLLSIIEAAKPDANLTDQFNWYTIPADTVRMLKKEGLIEEGQRRESTYSKLTRLSSNLSDKNLELSKDIASRPEETQSLVAGMDNKKAADVLDVSIEAFDYYNFEKILQDDAKTKAKKEHILSARAKNPVITHDEIDPSLTRKDDPALSHSPTRLSLAEGYTDQVGKYTRFEFRAALHDVMDPIPGTMNTSQIEMGKVNFKLEDRYYKSPKFIFQDFTIFNIKNYPEQNFWASPTSWEVDVGAKQLHRVQCFDCPAAYVMGSIGNSLQIARDRLFMSVLVNGEVDIQNQFANNYRFGIGPKLFSRYRASDAWLVGLTSYYHFNTYEHKKMFQDYEWYNELELRHHLSESVSLSLKGNGYERERVWVTGGELGLLYFY